ncbi:MAG: 23S rRNA (guanosine(2251)-2'-O)-methyltransferase RlmB [Hyphomicrobiaceae bacterium]|nr:23S rRNA (guanosine(2251)-2'-O)-methyltransferase RlmB [Hyphomicrobiaceae bacterium]
MTYQKTKHSKPLAKDRGRSQRTSAKSHNPERVLLFGLHAVQAALANEKRPVYAVRATENAAHRLAPLIAKRGLQPERVLPRALDRELGADTVHQGVLLEAGPLDSRNLDELDLSGTLLVLDQVTDPHNVGAALRSAAAFGANALIMTQRHSPPLGGVLAKSASGALDLVPIVQVRNLAEALAELGERGVMRLGLAEEAETTLEATPLRHPLALILGAEGRGLRQLTRERCDALCRISTASALASLNVSNAAAIALHWAQVRVTRD